MDMESILGKMGEDMKGIMKWIRSMVMEYINGQMEGNMKVTGKMESNMARENTFCLMAGSTMEDGLKVSNTE